MARRRLGDLVRDQIQRAAVVELTRLQHHRNRFAE